MSGTVAVRGETGVGGGGSGCLSRLDSDRCGHFRRLFLDSCVYVWESETQRKCVCVCMWGHQLMLCILTVHLNLSLFILRQIAMAGKVNKRMAWLGLAADVFLLKAVWFYEFFPSLWRSLRKSMRGFRQSLGEWFSGNLIGAWRLCTNTCTEGGGSHQMLGMG